MQFGSDIVKILVQFYIYDAIKQVNKPVFSVFQDFGSGNLLSLSGSD